MPAHNERREFAKGVIDRAIRKALDSLGRKPRRAFLQMLGELRTRSELLRPGRQIGHVHIDFHDMITQGLLALFEDRKDWIRPVETWEPVGRTTIAMFSSLAHHLLAEYPVPPVLLSAWFQGTDWSARRQQRWFRHAGRGQSLRTAGLPIVMTKRMAHEFCHAPAEFPISFALRWAQVRGLGGSDRLARAVAATRLSEEFTHEEFWTSTFQFFINHPELEFMQIGPAVEFLYNQRCEPRQVLIGDAAAGEVEIEIGPPQPELSLKGWSVASLLRRVEEWHATQRATEPKPTLIRWGHSAIGEFAGQDEQGRAWTIRELLDSNELAAEGRAMDHCVATYTRYCAQHLSTIWSLGIEGAGGRERVVTVEVNPKSREVVQAQAKSNEEPDDDSRLILQRWALQESLKLESCPS